MTAEERSAAADQVRIITPSLISWSVYDSTVKTRLTSQALATSEGWWVVDPVPLQKDEADRFFQKDPLLGFLLTSNHHERSCRSWIRSGAVHAHEATLGRMERNPDFFFHDGEKLKGGIDVVDIPGITFGECCFYHREQKILLMGDALIHLSETGFAFLPDQYCSDRMLARKSLKRLLDLDFDIMTFAHGEPLIDQPKQKLRQLLSVA